MSEREGGIHVAVLRGRDGGSCNFCTRTGPAVYQLSSHDGLPTLTARICFHCARDLVRDLRALLSVS